MYLEVHLSPGAACCIGEPLTCISSASLSSASLSAARAALDDDAAPPRAAAPLEAAAPPGRAIGGRTDGHPALEQLETVLTPVSGPELVLTDLAEGGTPWAAQAAPV